MYVLSPWQITVLTVYVFLYGRLYLVLSGLDKALATGRRFIHNQPLQVALASQSFVQLGILMALPMMMEIGLERGFRTALSDFILMQLQLAYVFFTFSLGIIVGLCFSLSCIFPICNSYTMLNLFLISYPIQPAFLGNPVCCRFILLL